MKGAELNKAVKDALASAEHKAIIESEVVAQLVGQARNSDKFLLRYARIGKVQLLLIEPDLYKYINMKDLFAKALDNFA